jgi:Flp pilus assembly protein TadG
MYRSEALAMKLAKARDKRKHRGLFRREDGSVSVEFVVWMPVFLVIFALIADAGTLYLIQASMWDTAMDCARRMATGQYVTASDVKTKCVQKELLYAYKPYSVNANFLVNGTDDTVEISLPMWEGGVFGVLAVLGGFGGPNFKIDVTAKMKAEV